MKTLLVTIGVVILIVSGWLLISKTGQRQNMNPGSSSATQTGPSTKSVKAPDFHLQDYSGQTVNLSDFAGKPLVINSWAVWCPFCKAELFDFAVAQKEFGKQVTIIAIDRADPLETAKKFSDEIGANNNLIMLLDPNDSFYQSIGGFSMPETIFVDKEGFVRDHKRGPMDLDEIRQRIKKIL